jgi:hypothetical protein
MLSPEKNSQLIFITISEYSRAFFRHQRALLAIPEER